MSGVFKAIGTIAGVVAIVFPPLAPIAAAVSIAAGIGAQLTARPPAARGSVNSIVIQPDSPSPYLMGRTYSGGTLRHDTAWGGKVGKVENPYRGLVTVYSVAGPVQALDGLYFDYQALSFSGNAATGYYSGFLYRSYQLGQRPESSALASQWASMPGWGSTAKLSSKAAVLWNLKFDKDGKRYASGVPLMGAVWQGVKVYDPRLDSTYPGGSGSQRIADESTWTYSANPALHAIAYLYGRYISGKKVFGVGLPVEGIDLPAFVALANVCDSNGWVLGGVIYEPDDRWENLKNILAAAGAEPIFSGGQVSCKYDAPRVSLATITADDLGSGPVRVRAMQSFRDRLNGIIPKYRSEVNKWEYVASDEVTVSTYVTEDGERKTKEIQWNLVQDKNQAAQLAAYKLVNGRELVITLTCKPDWRIYQPGDMLTVNLPNEGLASKDAIIVSRTIDPATLAVTFTLIGETSSKHSYALGLTGTAPPTPSLTTAEGRDTAGTTNTIAAQSYVAATAPTAANENDVWFDSSRAYAQYVYVSGAWSAVAAAGSGGTQSLIVTAQTQTTSAIIKTLNSGQSANPEAAIYVTGLSGSTTQSIQIEYREAGGTFATLGSVANDSGAAGDTVHPVASATLTNSSGVTKTYEIRAVTSKTGGTGTVDQSRSYLRV